MTRILAFTPYADWRFHTRYEVTISRAAMLRGAEVRHLLCDAQMGECDVYGASSFYPRGRPLDLCQICQQGARDIILEAGLPVQWLGEVTSTEQKREAITWAQNLPLEELETAHFHGLPLGEWITTSVVSYFREYPVRFDDWQSINVWRGFLQGAAITALGLEAVFDEWKPDALLLFNGRMGPLRVALNLAQQRGIRVLIHERPWRPGGILLLENTPANSPRPAQEYALAWREAPLSTPQLDIVKTWLSDRRYPPDRGLDLLYANAPQGGAGLRERLQLDPHKKIWVMFTSSTDEFMGDPALQGPFATQEEWIEGVLAWLKRHPEIQMVIRVHPNVGGAGMGGVAKSQYQYFEKLRGLLPPNVVLVAPREPLSAYDLMDISDAALTYGTTAGLEMLALGKPVLTAPPLPIYERAQGVVLVEAAEQLEAALEELARRKPSREAMRGAFRCIYRCFYGFQKDFPLVRVDERDLSRFAYSDDSALLPGRDATLDAICDYLFEGRHLHEGPTAAELSYPVVEEEAFFAALEKEPDWIKPRMDGRRLGLRLGATRKAATNSLKNTLRPLKRRLTS